MAHELRDGRMMFGESDQRKRRGRSGQWPFMGLLLVFVFLAHDLVMTVDAHGEIAHEVSVAADAGISGTDGDSNRLSAVDACGVGGDAAFSASARTSTPLYVGARVDGTDKKLAATAWTTEAIADRARAPAVRRALLQVYRI